MGDKSRGEVGWSVSQAAEIGVGEISWELFVRARNSSTGNLVSGQLMNELQSCQCSIYPVLLNGEVEYYDLQQGTLFVEHEALQYVDQ